MSRRFMKRPRSKCPSGKVGFVSRTYAEAEIGVIARTCETGYVPVRSYHCSMCDCWHLTSRDEFQGASVDRRSSAEPAWMVQLRAEEKALMELYGDQSDRRAAS